MSGLEGQRKGIHESYVSHMEKEGQFFAASRFPEHNEGEGEGFLNLHSPGAQGLGQVQHGQAYVCGSPSMCQALGRGGENMAILHRADISRGKMGKTKASYGKEHKRLCQIFEK